MREKGRVREAKPAPRKTERAHPLRAVSLDTARTLTAAACVRLLPHAESQARRGNHKLLEVITAFLRERPPILMQPMLRSTS